MRIAELSAHEKGLKKVLRKTNGFKCINVVLIKFNSKRGNMNSKITKEQLQAALSAAGSTHHEYEVNYLSGVRDEMWPGFYAAYALGKLGDFAKPTELTRWLEEAPADSNWAADAAGYVLSKLT